MYAKRNDTAQRSARYRLSRIGQELAGSSLIKNYATDIDLLLRCLVRMVLWIQQRDATTATKICRASSH